MRGSFARWPILCLVALAAISAAVGIGQTRSTAVSSSTSPACLDDKALETEKSRIEAQLQEREGAFVALMKKTEGIWQANAASADKYEEQIGTALSNANRDCLSTRDSKNSGEALRDSGNGLGDASKTLDARRAALRERFDPLFLQNGAFPQEKTRIGALGTHVSQASQARDAAQELVAQYRALCSEHAGLKARRDALAAELARRRQASSSSSHGQRETLSRGGGSDSGCDHGSSDHGSCREAFGGLAR